MIRSKVSESTNGLMGASMRVGGIEASSMELEPTMIARRELSNTASGKTESGSDGLTIRVLL